MPPQSNYKFKWWDDDGNPLVGGLVYTYVCGTTTDKATYTSATMQTENANPVVLDSNGEAIIYLAGPTKFVVKDSDGNSLDEQDYVGVNVQDVYDVSIYGTWGSQAAVEAAIADMGADYGVLYFGAGTWTISSDLTIASYITVRMEPGAKFYVANTKTLTINGPIEAGPYEIFTWAGTGSVELKDSPTTDIYLEWFGAVTGIAEDCTTAFAKIDDCVGPHQWVTLGSKGPYRITAAVTWTGRTLSTVKFYPGLKSACAYSVIQADCAGEVALTVGATGVNSYTFRTKGIIWGGEAACCTTALHLIRISRVELDAAFHLGSTDYACILQGCGWVTPGWVKMGYFSEEQAELSITAGAMANCVQLVKDSTWPNHTQTDLKVTMTGAGVTGATYGVYGDSQYDNIKIRGDIEGTITNGIYFLDSYGINLEDLHLELTASANAVILDGCENVNMSQVKGKNIGITTKLINCLNVAMDDCMFGTLIVYPGCYGITGRNIQVGDVNGLKDYSGCLEISGGLAEYNTSNNYMHSKIGQNPHNIITNTLMDRWQSGTVIPDGWTDTANIVWSKAGAGEGDTTTPPHTVYCAKLVVDAGIAIGAAGGKSRYTLSAAELAAIKGSTVTSSIEANIASGQTFTSTAIYTAVSSVVAAWAASTAYKVGDAVLETGASSTAYNFVCVEAGTTGLVGTEPTWTGYALGDEVDETATGGPKWVACYTNSVSSTGSVMTTDQSDDNWYKVAAGPVYVPLNATAVYFDIYAAGQAAAEGTFYVAEPVLKIGSLPSRGLQLGQNEFANSVKVGPNKLSWGATYPGASTGWHADGDLHIFNAPASGGIIGWVCTTAGLDAAAAWSTLPQSSIGLTGGTLTLETGAAATTTTVTNAAVTATSRILLMSTGANSAVAGIYVSAKNAGVSFVVTHPADPGAAATMDYLIFT